MARDSKSAQKMLDSDLASLQRHKRAEHAEMHVRYLSDGFPARRKTALFPAPSEADATEKAAAALKAAWQSKSLWSLWCQGKIHQYFVVRFLIAAADASPDILPQLALARLLSQIVTLHRATSRNEAFRLCTALQKNINAKSAMRDAASSALPALHAATRAYPHDEAAFLTALAPLMATMASEGRPAEATCDAFLAGSHAADLSRSLSLVALPSEKSEFIEHMVLAYGGFGKVELAWSSRWQKPYAIKRQNIVMIVDKEHEDKILLEWRAHKETRSRFILPSAFAYIDNQDLVLGLQFMPGGDLSVYVRRAKDKVSSKQEVVDSVDRPRFGIDSMVSHPLDTKKCGSSGFGLIFYLGSVVLALEALHAAGFVYRDLKDRNVLLDQHGQAKLADFGLAADVSKEPATGSSGTKGYWAPEQVAKKSEYRCSPDFWALGVCAYHWSCLKLPFAIDEKKTDEDGNEMTKDEIKEAIKKRVLTTDYDKANRPPLKAVSGLGSFVDSLLVKAPEARLGGGVGGWAAVRQHTFFKGFDWERLASGKLPAPIRPNLTKLNAELPSKAKVEFAQYEDAPVPEDAESTFDYWTFTSQAVLEDLTIEGCEDDALFLDGGAEKGAVKSPTVVKWAEFCAADSTLSLKRLQAGEIEPERKALSVQVDSGGCCAVM